MYHNKYQTIRYIYVPNSTIYIYIKALELLKPLGKQKNNQSVIQLFPIR